MGLKILYALKSIDGAPGEFQVFPYGKIEIEGEDDAFIDETSMDTIIADFNRRGNDMVIDYEHQTLKGVQAPAAGWVKKLVNRGKEGLWAVVEWTKQAKDYLQNREYRYFSPVFWVQDQGRNVLKIENVALTNYPKVNNLRPIMAKMSLDEAREERESRSKKYGIGIKDGGHVTKPGEWEHVPDDQWLDPVNYRYPCPDADQTRAAASYWGQEDNQKQYTEQERSIINERLNKFRKKFNIGEYRKEAKMFEKLKKLFGLADDAGEDKVVEAAEAIVAKNQDLEKQAGENGKIVAKEVIEALDLKETDGVSTVVASIHALKQGGKGTVSREEFEKIQKDLRQRDAGGIVAKAMAEGKVTPDQKDWATEYAERDLEGFKVFAAKAPVVVPMNKLPKKETRAQDAIADEAVLNVAKMFGNTTEDIKKYGGVQTG